MERLKRPIQQMPEDVRQALEAEGMLEAYGVRPPYQRNDYLAWIMRARQPQTRAKRLAQMLAELRGGTQYMGMVYDAAKYAEKTAGKRKDG